jgi:hypothetical protein
LLQRFTRALQLSRRHRGGTAPAMMRDLHPDPLPKEWASDGSVRFSGLRRSISRRPRRLSVARCRRRCGIRILRIPSDLLRNPLPSVHAAAPLADRRRPGSDAVDVQDLAHGDADQGYGAPRSMGRLLRPTANAGSKDGRRFLRTRRVQVGSRDRALGAVTLWEIEDVLQSYAHEVVFGPRKDRNALWGRCRLGSRADRFDPPRDRSVARIRISRRVSAYRSPQGMPGVRWVA